MTITAYKLGAITGIKVSQMNFLANPILCVCVAGVGAGVGVKLLILVYKYAWSNWTSNQKNDSSRMSNFQTTEKKMNIKTNKQK